MNKKHLILGYGDTGVSIAKYLHNQNVPFIVMDSREGLDGQWLMDNDYEFINGFNVDILDQVEKVYLSPGISINNPVLIRAKSLNKEVETDIDIFLRIQTCFKILISGTNGKTTVTSMAHKLFSDYLLENKVLALGNIGNPVLNNLSKDIEIALIEVSSFHLELSSSISSDISVLLNVSQDHLDRHSSFDGYKKVKKKIFNKSKLKIKESSSDLSTEGCFYYKDIFNEYIHCFDGLSDIWALHDIENIKAAISILLAYLICVEKLSFEDRSDWEIFIKDCLNILNSFNRLPHRFETLGSKEGITYINDSKATNISSTLKALNSLQDRYGDRKVILLCGGDSKGQDLNELRTIPTGLLKKVYIFGLDKDLIASYLRDFVDVIQVKDMKEALSLVVEETSNGDVILLSPACSSTDMYNDYKERGEEFRRLTNFI